MLTKGMEKFSGRRLDSGDNSLFSEEESNRPCMVMAAAIIFSVYTELKNGTSWKSGKLQDQKYCQEK